jgi:hypothetical protein
MAMIRVQMVCMAMIRVRVTMMIVFGYNVFRSDVHYTTLTSHVGKIVPLALRAPLESTGTPEIQQACQQNKNEYTDFNVTKPACLANGDGPGKEKRCLKVENDKKYGGEIERYCDFELCRTYRQHAGFVYVISGMVPALLSQQGRHHQETRYQSNDDHGIYDEWPKIYVHT